MTTTIATNFSTRLFDASDAFDLDRYVNFLAPDVRFQFGNAAPIRGRDNVREAVGAFFGTIAGIRHDILVEWFPEKNVSVQKLSVTYTRHAGTPWCFRRSTSCRSRTAWSPTTRSTST